LPPSSSSIGAVIANAGRRTGESRSVRKP
jgi:hypothetical protein